MMSIYLHDIPLNEAIARLASALEEVGLWKTLAKDWIALDENAIGRVIAEPVWARISSPHYHASAMDGFAVKAKDTEGAMLNQPLTLTCNQAEGIIQAMYVDTGDPLPEWADAVIPIENIEPIDPEGGPHQNPRSPFAIRVRASVTPWQHIRPMGEDMVATQLVLPEGHILRPVDLGAIAASGHSQVCVSRKPRVSIIPTGTELVKIGQPVKAGEIIEFNSIVLAGQVNEWGGVAHRFEITPDQFEAIKSATARAALQSDLVLLNAGSSAGSEDFTASIVKELGELLVHGVAVRPGHPVIIGMLDRNRCIDAASDRVSNFRKSFTVQNSSTKNDQSSEIPVIGVPGYPVSAAITGEIFVEPLLACWLGRKPFEPEMVQARLTRKVTSPAGDDDYMRVVVGRVGERLRAAPLSRGSGVISSLAGADGILIVPRGVQGFPAGAEVTVRLYRPLSELEQTIFVIGSHDMTLDLVSQYLSPKGRRLSSANVGSLGGLIALRRGEAHLAGSHLLDPDTGTYNVNYIRQYLPGVAVKVVAFVDRQQGLIVQKGNPKSILSLKDLPKADVLYINRQRGAGTRVLLDYHLGLLGIMPDSINGYSQEEYTHLAVAAAIASGRADSGLGIAAAANALNLDFIPLYDEQYQLVIPEEYYFSNLLEPFLELLNTPAFRNDVASLPGYGVSRMGELVAEVG